MLIAMLIVPVVAFGEIGGVSEAMAIATQTNTEVFNWMNGVTVMGVISLMAWGFGYFGQPHIIVRFMAIRSVKDVPTAMVIGMGWMILSLIGALMVGLAGIAYVARTGIELKDPETIFWYFHKCCFIR